MIQEKKLIFLNSYLPRKVHNFASQVIKVFSDHQFLSHSRSETRLARALEAYFHIRKYHIRDSVANASMDALFIKNLRKNILEDSDRPFLMVKKTSLLGFDYIKKKFPNDIHLILIRDPKNVFSSLIKGMSLSKASLKNKLKIFGNLTGVYPWYYSRRLSKQVLNEYPKQDFRILRYEDLVKKDEQTLNLLKKLFNTQKSLAQIKREIDEIQVIDSSFYEEVKAKKIGILGQKQNSLIL